MKKLSALGLVLACSACSEGTNINQLFVSKDQKEAVDYLLERGQYHYDKKEYDKALEFADKAYAINTGNEDAATLLAYTHLAKGGADVFGLSENLIDQSSSESSSGSGSNSAVDSLTKLGDAIGVTEDDINEMGAVGNEREVNGETVSGKSSNPLFADHPITLPDTAVGARERATLLLSHLSKAIKVTCPFVSESVKILPKGDSTVEDPRHTATACPPAEMKRSGAKTHFIWALAHLTEAVAFNTFFSNINESITARTAAIEGQKASVADYVTALMELADIINIVLPTDPTEAQGAMLRAIFNDLDAASAAFAQMAGMPESLTKSITGALTDLRSKSSKLEDTVGDKDSAALKAQLLQKSATKIREEMKRREGTMSQTQKDDACAAYNSITTEVFDMCPRA